MRGLAQASWLVLAAVHLLPALAALQPSLIERLYGIPPAGDTHLLLRHRAFLFAGIVVLCIWAALRPETRRLACVTVALSVASFLALWLSAGAPASLRTIAVADALALPFLGLAARDAFR